MTLDEIQTIQNIPYMTPVYNTEKAIFVHFATLANFNWGMEFTESN